jgi:Xaa-Pro dipeptidase
MVDGGRIWWDSNPNMNRRSFLRDALAFAGAAAGASCAHTAEPEPPSEPARGAGEAAAAQFRHLSPMTAGIAPITAEERQARIEQARRLMRDRGLDAMFLESGSSLFYYTGVRWGRSERPFGVVIPVRGEPAWVAPAFEEQRAWELLPSTTDLRVWQEDGSPYRVVAGILRDRGAAMGRIGIEESVRFFVYDGLRAELGGAQFVSATPVTAGGRMIKSPAEIALLQQANAITLRAIREAARTLRPGMSQHDLAASVSAATTALGGDDDGALVAFGKESARFRTAAAGSRSCARATWCSSTRDAGFRVTSPMSRARLCMAVRRSGSAMCGRSKSARSVRPSRPRSRARRVNRSMPPRVVW